MTAHKLIVCLGGIVITLCLVGAFFLGRATKRVDPISTPIERDTASYSKPLPDTVEKITTIYIKVPERVTAPKDDVADSVSVGVVERDSSEVAVDIERKVYEHEKYKATIRGPSIGEYSPVLESIDIYTQTETRVVQQPVKWIRPYVSALAGKDVLGIGGGVMIKERVSLGAKYMRFNNKDVVGAEINVFF